MLVVDLPAAAVEEPVRWRPATKIVFRFAALYCTLYILTTQMLGGFLIFPGLLPNLGATGLMKGLVYRTAVDVFKVPPAGIVTTITGSGDKTMDWVHAFVLLVLAAAGTLAWSAIDRRRPNYAALNAWFRVFLRFGVGATMISYGMVKAIPLQMPAPSLQRLVEPFGHFSPMGVLWYSIGASPGYERFAGFVELIGGVLLLIPPLALLGAIVTLSASIQIFTLNMTYDVPVKLFSFHLIVMSLVLLAPEMRRLLRVIVMNKPADASKQPPLFQRRRLMHAALVVQLVFGAYIVGMNYFRASESWSRFGPGAPKSPLYGIWNVSAMKVDGVERPPLITDYGRWRRLLFSSPTNMSFQRMDETFQGFGTKIDMAAKTLVLTTGDKESGRFRIEQMDGGRMILDGEMDGRKLYFDLRHYDRTNFLLVTRGFNWIQERPFNR